MASKYRKNRNDFNLANLDSGLLAAVEKSGLEQIGPTMYMWPEKYFNLPPAVARRLRKAGLHWTPSTHSSHGYWLPPSADYKSPVVITRNMQCFKIHHDHRVSNRAPLPKSLKAVLEPEGFVGDHIDRHSRAYVCPNPSSIEVDRLVEYFTASIDWDKGPMYDSKYTGYRSYRWTREDTVWIFGYTKLATVKLTANLGSDGLHFEAAVEL